MSMTYGLNSFLFESPFTNKSFHLIKKVKDWGFDTIEIAIEDPTHVDPQLLKKLLTTMDSPVAAYAQR